MDAHLNAKPKATLRAVVTRKDGSVEDLGVVASTEDAAPGFVERAKEAWRAGRDAGTQRKDGDR